MHSSKDLWDNIDSRYARSSSTHSIQLRLKLQFTKLGSGTVSTFLSEIKKITDELFAAGSQIHDDELVVTILNGLGQDYSSFCTSIRIRNPPISSKELHNLLLTEEIVVTNKQKNLLTEANSKAFAATRPFVQNYRGSGRGYHYSSRPAVPYSGYIRPPPSFYPRVYSQFHMHSASSLTPSPHFNPRPHYSSAPSSSAPPPITDKICQICNKTGHLALE
ncbi:uncharacterized protein LOC113305074 [Papaver somniferum]|uniref:uncharacterized protein LOC113305074 n=1 Tax=Papaver somniferum TaxID=3469 RepID=UPI000E6F8F54|nr:uncharacterized protein LOC113305074 [Papaver somniferum]